MTNLFGRSKEPFWQQASTNLDKFVFLLHKMLDDYVTRFSGDFSARMAADLCGKAERLEPGYTITEAGQDARLSMLTGRPAAHRTGIAAKTYSLVLEDVFQPKAFAELQNGQAIVLPYDGLNPQPPTYCYHKPHDLNVQTSYFDHLVKGAL
jgi:hypothetical protein